MSWRQTVREHIAVEVNELIVGCVWSNSAVDQLRHWWRNVDVERMEFGSGSVGSRVSVVAGISSICPV